MTATYRGTIIANSLAVDTTFTGPITVPSGFVGIHNNSIGSGHAAITDPAVITVALINGKVVPTVVYPGSGYYYSAHKWTLVVFSGGDSPTPAVGYPTIDPALGGITGVVITDHGHYTAVPPSISLVRVGGPNLPVVPDSIQSIRTHDYIGSFAVGATCWYTTDPSDGSGNYNWAALDECILWHGGLGREIMYGLHGTPTNYATSLAYIGVSFENQLGASSPLNAAGLVVGQDNHGLWGFIKALVLRYNINTDQRINPHTGQYFPPNMKFIKEIEVWNEPTFGANGTAIPGQNGKYWLGTAQQLVDIARIVNLSAKAIDPDIQIVGCGFTAGYPMGVGTTSANHFYNFLVAVDSVQGLGGYDWCDGFSLHPYDLLETGSHFMRATSRYFAPKIAEMRSAISAVSSLKPVYCTEWGFYDPDTVFQKVNNPILNGIQINRIYAEHLQQGVRKSFGYSLESIYFGYPTFNPYGSAYLEAVGLGIAPGKTLITVKRDKSAAKQLIYSDGSTYYTT